MSPSQSAVESANAHANASSSTPTRKLSGYEFFRQVLKSPKYIVAPMVDQSEYAWRELSRRYNSELCYTPMYHAKLFVEHPKYRHEAFTTGEEDRPLFVQFCANDPQFLLDAAKLVQDQCDAVDLNLGCPQNIAKRGHYGSFLQDEWPLISEMVSTLHKNLDIPVTVKIRVFDELEKSVEYAKMIEAAGAQILCVHGRTREMKGPNTGLADWDKIKAIKEAVSIPVIANGNILYFEDVQKCIDYTGVDAIMSAETNLYNPALFSNKYYASWKLAEEYLDIVREKPTSAHLGMMKGHIFKLFHPCLNDFTDIRDRLSAVHSFADVENVVKELKSKLLPMAAGTITNTGEYIGPIDIDENGYKIFPIWVSQPKLRRPKSEEEKQNEVELAKESSKDKKRDAEEHPPHTAKKAKQDRMEEKQIESCTKCSNVSSKACPMSLCKPCCRRIGRELGKERDLPEIHQNGRVYYCYAHKLLKFSKKDWGQHRDHSSKDRVPEPESC